ncbi:MAG: hypothetical protein QW175_05735, partial [Candidatus Bathyarchaeia archaeon]
MTLLDVIRSCLETIDFTSPSDLEVLACGLIFGKLSPESIDAYMETLVSQNDWIKISILKRYAEIVGYTSLTIDGGVKNALDAVSTVGGLPVVVDSNFHVSARHLLYFAKYAEKLGYRTEKWNAHQMYNSLSK